MCLVGRQRKKKKLVGTDCFLFGSTKVQSLQNRVKTREKTFVHMKKNIWSLMLCYSFFLLFFFLLRSTYFLYSLCTYFLLLLFFVFQLAPAFLSTLLSSSPFSSLPFFLFFFPFFIYLLLFPLFTSLSLSLLFIFYFLFF